MNRLIELHLETPTLASQENSDKQPTVVTILPAKRSDESSRALPEPSAPAREQRILWFIGLLTVLPML